MEKCAENTAFQRQQNITFNRTYCIEQWLSNWLHKSVSQFVQFLLKNKAIQPSLLAISQEKKSLNFYQGFNLAFPQNFAIRSFSDLCSYRQAWPSMVKFFHRKFLPHVFAPCVRYFLTHFDHNSQTLLRHKITVQHCNLKITHIHTHESTKLTNKNGPINHTHTQKLS